MIYRLALFVIAISLLAGCTPSPPTTPTTTPWQITVNDMMALHQNLRLPEYFLEVDAEKKGTEFDVNTYFSVLDHLSMQERYVLDYVYFYGIMGGMIWGEPIIYSRPANQSSYRTYSEYMEATGYSSLKESPYQYMDHIQVDGTAEGFFQFVVLRILGGQFYQYRSAIYNDARILCDQTGLEEALLRRNNFETIPDNVRLQAESLDLEPRIEFQDSMVVVRVVIFTKWGGFIEETYVIDRDFPHRVMECQREILVPYDYDTGL
jgi:hypothetical protein